MPTATPTPATAHTPTPTATPEPTVAHTPTPTATPEPASEAAPTPSGNAAQLRPGDADCDGAITPADALLMLQAAAGLPPRGCAQLADLDCDGALTAGDARAILKHLVGITWLLTAACPHAGNS